MKKIATSKATPTKLILFCVECGEKVHAPFDGSKLESRRLFQEIGWFLSVVDPEFQVMAPVCGDCAEKVYPPDLLAEAKRRFSEKPS